MRTSPLSRRAELSTKSRYVAKRTQATCSPGCEVKSVKDGQLQIFVQPEEEAHDDPRLQHRCCLRHANEQRCDASLVSMFWCAARSHDQGASRVTEGGRAHLLHDSCSILQTLNVESPSGLPRFRRRRA